MNRIKSADEYLLGGMARSFDNGSLIGREQLERLAKELDVSIWRLEVGLIHLLDRGLIRMRGFKYQVPYVSDAKGKP